MSNPFAYPAPYTSAARRLEGRVAIVTGGGRGIGEAISMRFAEQGARVLIATRTAKYGEETVARIREAGYEAELIAVELGHREASRQIVDKAQSLWGQLDILVHNAAFVPHGILTDMPDETYQKAFDVGPTTGFWLIKDAYPLLKRSKAGRIIMTSSLSADRNHIRGLAAYSAVKGAINSLVRGAALELGPDGITVNAVSPGGTMSASFQASLTPQVIAEWESTMPLKRVGQGIDIANAMLFLASDDGAYVTGTNVTVDGGQVLGMPLKLDGVSTDH